MTWLKWRANYYTWRAIRNARLATYRLAQRGTDAEATRKAHDNWLVAVRKTARAASHSNVRDAAKHGDRAALATVLLAHPRSRFAFNSPTGGTARVGLLAAAKGQKSRVYATNRSGPEYVYISTNLLAFLVDLCDHAAGPILINCIVNGHHRDDSSHYDGNAADVDKSSATSTGQQQSVGARHDIQVLDEDSAHWHDHTKGKV